MNLIDRIERYIRRVGNRDIEERYRNLIDRIERKRLQIPALLVDPTASAYPNLIDRIERLQRPARLPHHLT